MIRTEPQSLNSLHTETFVGALKTIIRAVVELPVNLLKQAHEWQRRETERRQLAELSDHQLKDMGISRESARLEYTKPFWLP